MILPGSKQTVDDLRWLRERGFEQPLRRHVRNGGLLVGICGGLQMLGHEIRDPHGAENGGNEQGLGLLPLRTTMTSEKVTSPARGYLVEQTLFGVGTEHREVCGYEIHMGETECLSGASPFATIRRSGREGQFMDGCVSDNRRVLGTYLHRLFDDDAFRRSFLKAAHAVLHLPDPAALFGWRKHRQQQLDRLADTFTSAVNLDSVFGLLNLSPPMVMDEATRR